MKKGIFEKLKNSIFQLPEKTKIDIECTYKQYVDDTYDEKWFESGKNNISQAIIHAKQKLEQINLEDKSSYIDCITRVCKDLDNYFDAANIIAQNKTENSPNWSYYGEHSSRWHENVEKIITYIASIKNYDIDLIVTSTILKRSNTIGDKSFPFLPDYHHLYIQIGDAALLCDGDINRALLWYKLAVIDWRKLKEKNSTMRTPNDLETIRFLTWWENFIQNSELLYGLLNDDVNHTSLIGVSNSADMFGKSKDSFQKYLDVWGSYNDGLEEKGPAELVRVAEEYINNVINDISTLKSEGSQKEKIRTEVSFAWIIKKQIGYYVLLSMALDDGQYSKDEANFVNAYFENETDLMPKAMPIYRYYKKIGRKIDKNSLPRLMNLARTINDCDKILNVLDAGFFSEKIAYYTSLDNLLKVLPDTADSEKNVGKLAIMHVAYMNDPNEGKTLKHKIFGEYNPKNEEGRNKAEYPFVFLKCFTTRIDDLPMWEMYGDHARGCCIVIDPDLVMMESKSVFQVYNVCYLKKGKDNKYELNKKYNALIKNEGIDIIKKSIDDIILSKDQGQDDLDYLYAFEQIINRITYLFKNADYSYECEKRILYTVPSGNDKNIKHTKTKREGDLPLLYYLPDEKLIMDEVIIGPKFEDASWKVPYIQEKIDKMNEKIGNENHVKISYSAIEYR